MPDIYKAELWTIVSGPTPKGSHELWAVVGQTGENKGLPVAFGGRVAMEKYAFTLNQIEEKGKSKMRSLILVVAVLSVLPSIVRAQGLNRIVDTPINNESTINSSGALNSPGGAMDRSSINKAKALNKIELARVVHGEVHPVEHGTVNDSAWTGPNRIVTVEEAQQLAAEQALITANATMPIAEAAKRAKEEATKAKAANESKTEIVAVQDANGNLVYIRRPKANKP